MIDLVLQDAFGNVIQPEGVVKICLEALQARVNKDRCLGFYNIQTRKWECESCVKEERPGFYCGTTNHFTEFSILIESNEVSISISNCEKEERFYVTGDEKGDALLLFFMFLMMIIVIIVCIILSHKYPRIHGLEHARLSILRESTKKITKRSSVYEGSPLL